MDMNASTSVDDLSMRFKEKNGNQIVIDATAEQRVELATFIRQSIDTEDDTLEDDACIDTDALEAVYQAVLSQIDEEAPLTLTAKEFWQIADVAGAWNGYVFENTKPEHHDKIDVKKSTVDNILEISQASLSF